MNNRIIVRLKAHVSLVGYKVENFRGDDREGFWMEVNPETKTKYYVSFDEIAEIFDKGERITFE